MIITILMIYVFSEIIDITFLRLLLVHSVIFNDVKQSLIVMTYSCTSMLIHFIFTKFHSKCFQDKSFHKIINLIFRLYNLQDNVYDPSDTWDAVFEITFISLIHKIFQKIPIILKIIYMIFKIIRIINEFLKMKILKI